MDFVSDALFDGRRLRLLTVIDLYTRECLGICVGQEAVNAMSRYALAATEHATPTPAELKSHDMSARALKLVNQRVCSSITIVI